MADEKQQEKGAKSPAKGAAGAKAGKVAKPAKPAKPGKPAARHRRSAQGYVTCVQGAENLQALQRCQALAPRR